MCNNIPISIEFNKNTDHFNLRWKRFHSSVYLMILFSLIWNTFTFIYIYDKIKISNVFAIFPVPGIHMIIGIYISYYCIAILFNKLDISITNNFIYVKDLNVPLGINKKINFNNIIKFEAIKQTYIYNRKRTYQINYILHDERRINLIYGLYNIDECSFIVKELNSYLNMEPDNGENSELMSLDTPREFLPLFIITTLVISILLITSFLIKTLT